MEIKGNKKHLNIIKWKYRKNGRKEYIVHQPFATWAGYHFENHTVYNPMIAGIIEFINPTYSKRFIEAIKKIIAGVRTYKIPHSIDSILFVLINNGFSNAFSWL